MSAPNTLSDLEWELLLNAITGAAASFSGAYGAWKIANRAERRKSLADEVAACNVAVGLCGSIVNVMLALRGQLLVPKITDYRVRFQKYGQVSEAAWLGLPYEPLEMGADLRTISIPFFPINDLQAAVASIRGNNQAPMLLAASRQAIESLVRSIERHNELTRVIRAKQGNMESLYFGLMEGSGADESFPDAMRGLDVQSLDALYYPELLAAVITRYGTDLSKRYGGGKWKVSRLAPANQKYVAIMPDLNDYPETERQFRPKDPVPRVEAATWYGAHYEGVFQ